MVRKTRTQLEEHFTSHLTAFLRKEFGDDVVLDSDQYDNPDALYLIDDKRVAIEFSQFPSSYIVHSFNVPLSHPKPDKHFHAERIIYPFEPHRWVQEVLEKKNEKIEQYKASLKADEYWLVMHAHTLHHDVWPMSKPSEKESKVLESHLMRFGA